MFWDKIAKLYDFNETVFNRTVNDNLCKQVETLICADDKVLECACGTGMLTRVIGQKAKEVITTDLSENMMKVAKRKCAD